MTNKYQAISPKFPHFLHGGDYNPDQWLKHPDILKEDIRLMKLAHCNAMSIGIFAWSAMEPEEGCFTFEWLDQVIDRLYENGIRVILATPSGARPAWLSQKYPEVLRVAQNGTRNLHGMRHNHCFTSPVYRQKVEIINTKLAERYSAHPAILAWHISNEYGGECHCELCQEAFRDWLKQRYTTQDRLNEAWWTAFWSHTYTDWAEIHSPAPHGELFVHGMNLDWKRFVTDQTIDFYKHEIKPLKELSPELPATTNLMEAFEGLNYFKFAKHLDVVSWDSYPQWHNTENDIDVACWVSMMHDLFRSLKGGQPFMLMESTPSLTNWQNISKLKKPGMHLLASLQAVAHGSDTVQYFQWRKSRGASEKFHGAVIDHSGHEHTRVFGEVEQVGSALEKLNEVLGTSIRPETAILFDWENRWAIKDSQGPRNIGVKYEDTVKQHYKTFWKSGVSVDIIDMDCDFDRYKLLIAPMLYMIRPGVAERIEKFVENGGCFVGTYWSGIVNENDLCFLGGFPGPLRKTLGIWSEELEALFDGEKKRVVFESDNRLELTGVYQAVELCDLIHTEGAQVLASYDEDFYAGRPALTVNSFGQGKAYYIASRNEEAFHEKFYGSLIRELGLKKTIATELPDGVTVQTRTDGVWDYVFVMNFSREEQVVKLDGQDYSDLLDEGKLGIELLLQPFGVKILKRNSSANE